MAASGSGNIVYRSLLNITNVTKLRTVSWMIRHAKIVANFYRELMELDTARHVHRVNQHGREEGGVSVESAVNWLADAIPWIEGWKRGGEGITLGIYLSSYMFVYSAACMLS